MAFTREKLYTVPIWVKLLVLDFKYWSHKGLSKIGSLIGRPLMVDKHTEQKRGLSFARLLIQVKMDTKLLDKVAFKNEKGVLMEQRVQYDWKPTLCKCCKKYELGEQSCRAKKMAQQTIPEKQNEDGTKYKEHREVPNANTSNVSLVSKADQAITCQVKHVSLQTTFFVTVVYAFNTREERRSLWTYLEGIIQGVNMPWLVIGDLNSVLKVKDRVGGNPISMEEIMDFHNCVEACGPLELLCTGNRYTWSDRHGDNKILFKIDWVFINDEWLNSMPDFKGQHLPE
ncbi:uncharacterized protein [Nicotiana tomentosiformis]|uniref:uncharacterized protein n=1 Tax=Nicotiana tomentosiformis TaxID=4098 RepID=UPI00388C8C0F